MTTTADARFTCQTVFDGLYGCSCAWAVSVDRIDWGTSSCRETAGRVGGQSHAAAVSPHESSSSQSGRCLDPINTIYAVCAILSSCLSAVAPSLCAVAEKSQEDRPCQPEPNFVIATAHSSHTISIHTNPHRPPHLDTLCLSTCASSLQLHRAVTISSATACPSCLRQAVELYPPQPCRQTSASCFHPSLAQLTPPS